MAGHVPIVTEPDMKALAIIAAEQEEWFVKSAVAPEAIYVCTATAIPNRLRTHAVHAAVTPHLVPIVTEQERKR